MNKNLGIGLLAIVFILLGGYFIFTGDPTSTDDSTKAENSPSKIFSSETYSKEVSELILDISELPEGYKVAERTPRTKSDVSKRGIGWGWKEGYYIRYVSGSEDNIFDTSNIELAISRYPLENISNGIGAIEDVEGYTVEELPNLNIGDGSQSIRYTENEFGFRSYRIEFYKKDIYVTLSNSGAITDYEVLKDLANNLESKI